ncbi:hypothetical protein MY4038_002990 [Beauveria bassiana]
MKDNLTPNHSSASGITQKTTKKEVGGTQGLIYGKKFCSGILRATDPRDYALESQYSLVESKQSRASEDGMYEKKSVANIIVATP